MSRSIRPGWLVASMLVCAAAQAGQVPEQTNETAPAASGSAMADQTVAIDRATGKLRAPTAEERQALASRANSMKKARRASASPMAQAAFERPATAEEAVAERRTTAAGAIAIKLPESEMSAVTARYDADGNLVLGHADDVHANQEQVNE